MANADSNAQQTPPGTWNAGALHAHFTDRLGDLQDQIDRRVIADQRVVDQSTETMKERIEALARLLDSEKDARDKAVETALRSIDKRDEANREATGTKLDAMSARLDKIEQGAYARAGGEAYQEKRTQAVQPWQIAVMGFAVTFLVVAVTVAANILTSH